MGIKNYKHSTKAQEDDEDEFHEEINEDIDWFFLLNIIFKIF